MTHQEVFGNAKWIGVDPEVQAPYIRKRFKVANTAEKAIITICGLGFFDLYINDIPIHGEDYFKPVTSDYIKRDILVDGQPFDEEMGHRIYYVKYDVTAAVKFGENEIKAALGPGWFATPIYHYGRMIKYGDVMLCYKLDIHDSEGNVQTEISDENDEWQSSYVVSSNLFNGEEHDYLKYAKEQRVWHPVRILEEPDTQFCLQDCPNDYCAKQLIPQLVKDFGYCKVYDVGANISGWVYLRAKGKPGDVIKVRFSEELNDTMAINRYFHYDQEWKITLDGQKRSMKPEFTWYGFRYIAVYGDAEPYCAEVIHTDTAINSHFECENATLNWLYDTYLQTQLMNMHAGIPSDCPHIERRGYTGDGQLCAHTGMLLLDAKKFYRKWLYDIADCQDRNSGHVQYTAPYTQCGGGPGGWGCAIITVPYNYYLHYGDTAPMREMYDGMIAYLKYLEEHSENHIVISDREGSWCLGDWCTADTIQLPEPYVNTYFYIRSLRQVYEIENILGLPHYDPEHVLENEIVDIWNAKYFDPNTGNYAGGIQGANAFALDLHLGDQRTLANMAAYYRENGYFDTGIFGTELVARVLFEQGYPEIAYNLLTTDHAVSFEGLRRAGATTLWEYWPGEMERSHNHPMFGAVTACLIDHILGIRQKPGTAGWTDIEIHPLVTDCLFNARGSITTPQGVISVQYTAVGDQIRFEIWIPEGCNATLSWKENKAVIKAGVHTILWN